MIVSVVMTDHPSWREAGNGMCRAVRRAGSVWMLTCRPVCSGGQETVAEPVSGVGDPPVLDVIDPTRLLGPVPVIGPLRGMGSVGRWRNPDLWDALATAVIRQVIRAGQARVLYQALSRAHGAPVTTALGRAWLFPTPEAVLALPDVEFGRLGLAFKRAPLRALAEAFLSCGEHWSALDPAALMDAVQQVPRIGPWTAGASVADLTNDYARYPFGDLAVRTWARRLAPERPWPDTETDFAEVWAQLAGDEVSALTMLTLAWGLRQGGPADANAI